MAPEKKSALITIIRESERLRGLAVAAREAVLAEQFERLTHEAGATLVGYQFGVLRDTTGAAPPASEPELISAIDAGWRQRVVLADANVRRQRQLVARLRQRGLPAGPAETLLGVFENMAGTLRHCAQWSEVLQIA